MNDTIDVINERILRITGSACISEDLKLDQDITVLVKASIVKTEEGSKQNGMKDRIFKAKMITAEIQNE